MAAFTADHQMRVLAVALIACFIGHYLMTVSYSCLMFCITVAVLQLYEFMGAFNLQLLGLRLAETLLGAAIAAATAYLLLPIRTQDTAAHLARGFFHVVAELLDDLAAQVEAGIPIDTVELATTQAPSTTRPDATGWRAPRSPGIPADAPNAGPSTSASTP